MACLNINSLLAHIDDLRVYMSDSKEIDILAINETKLDPTIRDEEVYVPNCDLIRKDRHTNGRNGGGVCFYIRNNINFQTREDLSSDKLECLTIQVTKPHSKPFLVSTWYRPPHSHTEIFNSFEQIIDKIDAEDSEVYILGDLNCNFLPDATDHCSTHLRNIMDIYGLNQMIAEPTRITQASKTLIDLCLTNFPEKIANSGVIHLGISDHSLIFVKRKIIYIRPGAHKTIQARNLKDFNEVNFLRDLSQQNWNVTSYKNPNEMWHTWKHTLMCSFDRHAPIRTKRIQSKKSPWITKELIRKIHKRDFFKRKAVHTNDHDSWKQYKTARNDVNNSIKHAKREYFTTNLAANKNDPRKAWKLINDLQSRLNKSTNVSEINIGDQTFSSPGDIAEAFNRHFANIGENLARKIPETDIDPLSYLDRTDKSFAFEQIETHKVSKLLNKIDSKKATGLDKIPSKLLKLAADIVSPSLTCIFNASIATGIFPDEWKKARVSPVFKKGTKSDPNNYRPISVIPVVSKIFEKLIYDQVYQYLTANDILTNCQSGFRSLHSTLSALLEATDSWCVNIDKGLLNGVLFIDLKKAFDTINHKIILDKLSIYGFDQNVLTWFDSYLSNRSQKCNVNGHLSSESQITCGVPQGSIIGPLLFLIYINDLPNCLIEGLPRMYADDTNISVAASNKGDLEIKINAQLENVNIWLRANKLSLNIAKTEFMIIGSRQKLQTQTDRTIDVRIDGDEIESVHFSKSLGVYIDDTLSWRKHVEEMSKKISSSIGALKRVRQFINGNTAETIYKAIIEPYFVYCCPVWDGLSQQLNEKLQKLQNRAARVITKSRYYTSAKPLIDMLGWDSVSTYRTKQKALVMYKTMHNLTPTYLQDLFTTRHSHYNLRDSEDKLSIPKPRTDYMKRSLRYSGAFLWNNLPRELRASNSIKQFKRGIDTLYCAKSDSHTANM